MDAVKEYQDIIHYLALFLVLGSLIEMYVRKKGYLAHTDKVREGVVITGKRPIGPPVALFIIACVIAAFTWPGGAS